MLALGVLFKYRLAALKTKAYTIKLNTFTARVQSIRATLRKKAKQKFIMI